MKSLVKSLSLLTIFICLFFSCRKHSSHNEYAMFRGNLNHTGIYPSPEVKPEPTLKWRFKTGGYVNSSAAFEGDNAYFGSADGYLYCVTAAKGELVWKYKTGGSIESSPALSDSSVFFGSYDGNFYALNANDGKMKWIFKTGGEKSFPSKEIEQKLGKSDYHLYDTWTSSPAVKNDIVYFGSGDGNFYAVDKTTGKEKWKFETKGIIHSSPALAFGNVYFGGWDTYLHALDEKSGKEKWKFKTGEDTVRYNQTGITSSPVLVDSMLYFGCRDSNLYALKALTGELVWKRYHDDIWVSSTPLVYENKILYSAGRPNTFTALNRMNGDSIYKHVTKTGTSSSLSLAGKTVYYGDLNGVLNAHDVNTGELLWTYQIPTSVKDTFQILDQNTLTISQEGFAAAIEKNRGIRERNSLRFSLGAIHSSPVIKNCIVYFGAYDGYFYAVE